MVVVVVVVVGIGVVVGAGSMQVAVHCAPLPDFFLSDVNITFNPFFFPFFPLMVWSTFLERQNLNNLKMEVTSLYNIHFCVLQEIVFTLTYFFLPTCSESPFLHFFLSLFGKSMAAQ